MVGYADLYEDFYSGFQIGAGIFTETAEHSFSIGLPDRSLGFGYDPGFVALRQFQIYVSVAFDRYGSYLRLQPYRDRYCFSNGFAYERL